MSSAVVMAVIATAIISLLLSAQFDGNQNQFKAAAKLFFISITLFCLPILASAAYESSPTGPAQALLSLIMWVVRACVAAFMVYMVASVMGWLKERG